MTVLKLKSRDLPVCPTYTFNSPAPAQKCLKGEVGWEIVEYAKEKKSESFHPNEKILGIECLFGASVGTSLKCCSLGVFLVYLFKYNT